MLGVLSFVVPVPHRENHGLKIGDAKFSVETENSEKLPPAAGIVLLAAAWSPWSRPGNLGTAQKAALKLASFRGHAPM